MELVQMNDIKVIEATGGFQRLIMEVTNRLDDIKTANNIITLEIMLSSQVFIFTEGNKRRFYNFDSRSVSEQYDTIMELVLDNFDVIDLEEWEKE